MKSYINRVFSWTFGILAAGSLGVLVGCDEPQKQPQQSLGGGAYLFALNKDMTINSSNAVRETINRTLTPDFALPSKFVFVDPKAATIAMVSLPSLSVDNAQARGLQFSQSAPKLKQFVFSSATSNEQLIDPSAIRAAADALHIDSYSNRAVFFIGNIGTNSHRHAAKSSSRIPAYWLDCGAQSPLAREKALTALDEAGFDLVAHETDIPLFWESVLSTPPTTIGLGDSAITANVSGTPGHESKVVPTIGGNLSPITVGATAKTASNTDQVAARDTRIERSPTGVSLDAGANVNKPGLPLALSMQNSAPTKMQSEAKIGSPVLPFYVNTPVHRRSNNATNQVLAGVAAAPLEQVGSTDKDFDGSLPTASSQVAHPPLSADRLSKKNSPINASTGDLEVASSYSTDNAGLELAGTRHITEDELRSQLKGFNVDGKDVMDALPPSFVGIKYTHANGSDPIACMLSVAEKREFDFPGTAAGITRLVSKVVRQEFTEALECYGFDEKARKEGSQRLIVTLMRRPDTQDQETKTVEVIVHQGTQITIQVVTIPAGLGVVLSLSRFFQ